MKITGVRWPSSLNCSGFHQQWDIALQTVLQWPGSGWNGSELAETGWAASSQDSEVPSIRTLGGFKGPREGRLATEEWIVSCHTLGALFNAQPHCWWDKTLKCIGNWHECNWPNKQRKKLHVWKELQTTCFLVAIHHAIVAISQIMTCQEYVCMSPSGLPTASLTLRGLYLKRVRTGLTHITLLKQGPGPSPVLTDAQLSRIDSSAPGWSRITLLFQEPLIWRKMEPTVGWKMFSMHLYKPHSR